MIDSTLALLLPHSQTLLGAALLAATLAALILMDFSLGMTSRSSGDDG